MRGVSSRDLPGHLLKTGVVGRAQLAGLIHLLRMEPSLSEEERAVLRWLCENAADRSDEITSDRVYGE